MSKSNLFSGFTGFMGRNARIAVLTVLSVPMMPVLSGITVAQAAELSVHIEIPRLNVAEYHRPYVALWLEGEQRDVYQLAVWYDFKQKDAEGSKWLKDLRQWWRRGGRELSMPLDGLSSATRVPGRHQLVFSSKNAPLKTLPAGNYRLFVEAVREVGGREVLGQSFKWPPQADQQLRLQGKDELASLVIHLQP